MCGIAGKFYFQGSKSVDESLIHAMTREIAHRGPDDAGIYCEGPIGLGHQRLAIIDLSSAGHQPMSIANGMIKIIFNGEIYNFQELRKMLEDRGVVFRSHSDTEAILHLYEAFGEECLDYLRGMFAFAIWDARKNKLFIARDRVGKKPLKYYVGSDFIVFASELKAFLKDPEVPKEPDHAAIHHYLSFQYVPHPLTGFTGIQKLPPAHYLVVENGKIRTEQYWQLDYSRKEQRTEEEWQRLILEQLEEAVRLRMISDVPLGAFLSGGIDSSAVVGMMAKHSAKPVKTFSIGFKEQAYNELPYAQLIAQQFKTDHTEFIVEPHALDVLPKLIWHYEEPYADSSAIPTFYVCQLTRQHVTVVLNGDGGDENFAGYGRYNVHKFAAHYDRWPRWLLQGLIHPAAQLSSKIFRTTFFDRVARFSQTALEPAERRYLEYICYFNEPSKRSMYTPEFLAKVNDQDSRDWMASIFAQGTATNPVEQAMEADVRSYLPDDLLAKVDIAAMAVSLEGRSPFLDHKFMEFAATIPAELKLHGREKKYILRQALRGWLPDSILDRKKMGFGVPIEVWFRHELKDYLREHLLSSRAISRNIFKPRAVERLINEHQQTKINHAPKLWALLTLELWYQTFVD